MIEGKWSRDLELCVLLSHGPMVCKKIHFRSERSKINNNKKSTTTKKLLLSKIYLNLSKIYPSSSLELNDATRYCAREHDLQ